MLIIGRNPGQSIMLVVPGLTPIQLTFIRTDADLVSLSVYNGRRMRVVLEAEGRFGIPIGNNVYILIVNVGPRENRDHAIGIEAPQHIKIVRAELLNKEGAAA